ncbi:MAG: hypothetical protein FJ179_01570 [Gammaproteobacteria bacterium]|nr:hypothetical protein [Gammaproteobacteria bacterium]
MIRNRCIASIAISAAALASAANLAQSAAPAPAPAPTSLRVMTFNIWYGGEQVNFASVAEAIRASDADVIGIQESEGNLRRLAAAAGYAHVDTRRNLLARFPIFDGDLHAWVMVRPGEVVAVANTHLSSDLYGPESVRDGAALEAVLADEERSRIPELRPLLKLADLPASTPIFLTGDFNTPSHRDWTVRMQSQRPAAIRYPIEWPVTRLLENAGFRDSFREVFPDPAQRPGFTWTAGMPHPYLRPRETIDRIDFVWTKGPVETLRSEIVGEPGGDGVDISINPYPSDHRAVVSTFRVVPTAAPALVSVAPRVVTKGEDALVRAHDPRSEGWRVVIVRAGAAAANAVLRLEESVTAWRPAGRLATRSLASGEYEAILLAEDGKEIARNRFAIRDPALPVQLLIPVTGTRSGEPLRVRWSNGLGNKHDSIGIFRVGAAVGDALARGYLDARYAGEIVIPTSTADGPIAPGIYELRFLRDDSPTIEATLPFRLF